MAQEIPVVSWTAEEEASMFDEGPEMLGEELEMPAFFEPLFRPVANYTQYAADSATTGTPLAPSVEKAYYRKCIELKRRLNEVEAANNEAKIRRVRLERAIRKMRLERAFLLDEMRKRMDHNVDASEGSGDEGMVTVCVGHIPYT